MSHSRLKNQIIGKRFGRLLVAGEVAQRNVRGHILYECICDCGNKKSILGASLRSGATTSCGCAHIDAIKSHGLDGTPTHRAWVSMRSRCTNKKMPSHSFYGGRGISVCERWLSFQNFLDDMGIRPPGMSIDRIDVNGNYEPSNCRWATPKMQANNRRNNVRVMLNGSVVGIEQFAEHIGLTQSGARKHLVRNYQKDKNGVFVKEAT